MSLSRPLALHRPGGRRNWPSSVRSHTDYVSITTPAVMMMNTGSVRFGRPSMGSWLSYGLGSENENLPGFCSTCVWSEYQPTLAAGLLGQWISPLSVSGRAISQSGSGRPLCEKNPPGIDRATRREMLDLINASNRDRLSEVGDPENSRSN